MDKFINPLDDEMVHIATVHKNLLIEKHALESSSLFEENYYTVKGLKGNEGLTLTIREVREARSLKTLLDSNIRVFKDYIAIVTDSGIEVLVKAANFISRHYMRQTLKERPLDIHINYYKNSINASLRVQDTNSRLVDMLALIRGRYLPIILRINNLEHISLWSVL